MRTRATRLGSAKSNRWVWWQEAWHAFTRHPGGGTGAGTFELTNQMLRTTPVVVDEPHNTPLQFLSETGIVGFLLYLGVAGGALWGAWRARRDPAGLALGLARRRLLRARDRRQGLELRRVVRAALPRRGRARRAAAPRSAAPRRTLLAACGRRGRARRGLLARGALARRPAARVGGDRRRGEARALVRTRSRSTRCSSTRPSWTRRGSLEQANKLYSDAVGLEPENARTWYALGAFYFEHKYWRLAYDALNNSYTYDRFGKASEHCGLLDRARCERGLPLRA